MSFDYGYLRLGVRTACE